MNLSHFEALVLFSLFVSTVFGLTTKRTPRQQFRYGVFVQDNYRATRNLTLNIGLRWELNSFFEGIRGQTNAFDFETGKVISEPVGA